jgi:hypothetical protein
MLKRRSKQEISLALTALLAFSLPLNSLPKLGAVTVIQEISLAWTALLVFSPPLNSLWKLGAFIQEISLAWTALLALSPLKLTAEAGRCYTNQQVRKPLLVIIAMISQFHIT